MTSDDILRMAREAARYADAQTMDRFEWHGIRDEHFANLVAAHEREQCAAICDDIEESAERRWTDKADPLDQGRCVGAFGYAAAIRARGDA